MIPPIASMQAAIICRRQETGAKRFIHVHLKGAVKIEGKVYDNPPAGMDQTDWTSFMGILYGLGYDGGLSIEPESAYWHGELSDRGVDYTIRYFRNMMI